MMSARPRGKKDIFQMNNSKAVSFVASRVSASAVPSVSLMKKKVGKTNNNNNNNNKDNNNTKKANYFRSTEKLTQEGKQVQ